MVIASIVRRHMKRTSEGSFTLLGGSTEVPVRLQLDSDEVVIGWYRNPSPWEDTVIVFTSHALHLAERERVDRLPIIEMVGYESPNSKVATGLRVLTREGFRFVRIAGCFGPHGDRKDLFSFLMVLRALIPGVPIVRYPEDLVHDGVSSRSDRTRK